jgi:rSAM/selenodomain-associated transferase 2
MISVVIPTLNEAENLPRSIAALQANSGACELIVVDGGSTDRTCEIANKLGAHVIQSPVPQRSAQMNLGARCAAGEIILFLHADTLLPPQALSRVETALLHTKIRGGAFARRFDSPSLFLRLTCLLAEFRNRTMGWFLGDQAIFVCRELFYQLGGFSAMDQFEDLDFSRRLAEAAKVVTLRPPVISSARRFQREGAFARTLSDLCLTIAYLKRSGTARPPAPCSRKECSLGE